MLFNEPKLLKSDRLDFILPRALGFSALQRAEIAEIPVLLLRQRSIAAVSVLFNEPKLLKSNKRYFLTNKATSFSALQRAEIAEIQYPETVG